MRYALHVTAAAERDIIDAAEYIEYVLLNPQAAEDLLKAVEDTVSALAEQPLRIGRVSDPVLSAWGVRFIRVKNYLAFFVVDDETQRVMIFRFLYAKRNWMAILREKPAFDG